MLQPWERQARYFQLVNLGWNNNDACRQVGVHRKTGSRWRLGRTENKNGGTTFYPPAREVPTEITSARYLSIAERTRFAELRMAGKSMRFIATGLGRSTSTISRELKRNTDAATGLHLPHTANRQAGRRRARPKTTKLAAHPQLRTFVDHHLGKRYSPEQIHHELRVEFPDEPERHLAVETLYRTIYQPFRKELTHDPRTGRHRWRPGRYLRHRSALADPALSIDARPVEVNDRLQPGHLEGDLIIGRNGGSAVLTVRTYGDTDTLRTPDWCATSAPDSFVPQATALQDQ